ncbi:MAG: uracil-DNA glycosylase [Candidatus Paceibacterota bacterium]|jgi:DNA polymerase
MSRDIDERKEMMRQIKDEVVALKNSPLYKFRIENKNLPVIGDGSHSAKIMFIGEAPGKNEAKTGRPFCGRAGQILDELLNSTGLKREEIYITNIVKDRPPKNRDPLPEEIEIYGPFLDRQIEIVQPQVIATLGRYAMSYIMPKLGLESELLPIGKMHGRVFAMPHEALAKWGWKNREIKVIPLYHPCVAVYNSHTLDILKADFEILKDL